MAGRRRTAEPVVIPTNSLVASAVRYSGKAARIYNSSKEWQRECYRHYGICGEARFAARFLGHALSKATLSIARKGRNGKIAPQKSGPAVDALTTLFNGADGQAQMLSAIGIHLTIAGECFLVGREVEGEDVWEVVSVLEIRVAGKKWSIDYGDGNPPVDLTDDDVVIRIWNPSPEKRIEADSPFRSLLPILSEIEWLTRHIFAQTQSRLAGAGLLLVPQSMSFPPPPAIEGQENPPANEAEGFMLTLADAMLTPIQDPGSPSALIPVIGTVPDDSVDKVKLMHFWSELDGKALEMRAAAISRFADGMDIPREQVLGMSSNPGTGGGTSNGVSHWGAWQIEESTIKMHIEPMLELVANAITIGYIRPAAETAEDIVVADTSALRLRPDRSKEAFELYDRGVISMETLLRENGFAPADAMGEDEFKVWLLRKVASGSATPEQVAAALAALGVELEVAEQGVLETPREARPVPSLEQHPARPRTPEAALVAASEALVFRALERAGNRMRNTGAKPPNVPAYETHCHVRLTDPKVLEDAWSCAPQVLSGIADPEEIVPVLNSYCAALINEGSPHKRERLVNWLNLAVGA